VRRESDAEENEVEQNGDGGTGELEPVPIRQVSIYNIHLGSNTVDTS
jgi:hypothetical protein